ncbi:MAG: glutamate--tRNA ligase [Chthoniobacterales bacterium]
MAAPVRVRFAPSPTVFLHIGGARTALFNWLFAQHQGGVLVLRVEDTDAARNTEEAAAAIYDGLRWLGLEWDEGPQVGGDFGPYFQSERNDIYEKHLRQLEAGGHLYDDNGAIRFRAPREHVILDDVVCGRIDFDLTNPETHPDMTLRRPDGSWIFHFVNVVDDIEMKISHVIRGEDHLSNTPKHIELYRALGAEPPRFAYIPLILNIHGSKMSKRDAGPSVSTYLTEGFLPEAVRNYLCLLGWSPKDNREKIAIDEVVRLFELEKINRKSAHFDLEECAWLNGEYLRELPEERFRALGQIALASSGIDTSKFPEDYVRAALDTCRGKVKLFSELPAYCGFYFTEEIAYQPEGVAKHFTAENKPRLQALRDAFAEMEMFDAASLEAVLKATATQLGLKARDLVHPLRLAVTGSNSGPSLYHLLEILGKRKVLSRTDQAVGIIPA